MTDEERLQEGMEIARNKPQFFWRIYTLAEQTTSKDVKNELERLAIDAYHLQEGGMI